MTEIKNLKKAAERIKKAVKNKEKIILYGDADLDGISSVIILKEAIKNLGGKVTAVYFPDREVEGYGLNEDALNYLKQYSPALLLVLDCGIGNLSEVKLAKKMGFEVVIVDHHEPLKKLPQAQIIVNPKQKGDRYPFKVFAAAGVVFKLAEVLLKEKLSSFLKKDLLVLAALATMADMMPQEKDNAEILDEGLPSIKNALRPGLRAFLETDLLNRENSRQLAQKIISACHAGGTKNHLNEGYLLLSEISLEKAETLAQDLLLRAHSRQMKIKEITGEMEKKILNQKEEPIIFEENKDCAVLMLGPVAGKICQIFQKPVFLYNQRKDTCQGAVRTPEGVDGVKAMMRCEAILETYGGHPQAGGFRIKSKNLKQFKNCLLKYFKNRVFAKQKRR